VAIRFGRLGEYVQELGKELDNDGRHKQTGYTPTLEEVLIETLEDLNTPVRTARLHIQMTVQHPALELCPLPPLPCHGRDSQSTPHLDSTGSLEPMETIVSILKQEKDRNWHLFYQMGDLRNMV